MYTRVSASVSTVVSSATTEGSSTTEVIYFEDRFDGTAGTLLVNHAPDYPASIWSAVPSAGLSAATLTGNGGVTFTANARGQVGLTASGSTYTFAHGAGTEFTVDFTFRDDPPVVRETFGFNFLQWNSAITNSLRGVLTVIPEANAAAGAGNCKVSFEVGRKTDSATELLATRDLVTLSANTIIRIGVTIHPSLASMDLWWALATTPTSRSTLTVYTGTNTPYVAVPGGLILDIASAGTVPLIPLERMALSSGSTAASSVVTSTSTTTSTLLTLLPGDGTVDFEWRVNQIPAFFVSSESPVRIRTPLIEEP